MYTVTRRICIDAGHRIPTHGSKCRNLHGHRYAIEATCYAASLRRQGEETSMVVDFGFLKELMVEHIDAPCDHAMILYVDDPIFQKIFLNSAGDVQLNLVKQAIEKYGWWAGQTAYEMKVYAVPFIPTAEELAKHWLERLQHPVGVRSHKRATLSRVKVWETPNCSAEVANPALRVTPL